MNDTNYNYVVLPLRGPELGMIYRLVRRHCTAAADDEEAQRELQELEEWLCDACTLARETPQEGKYLFMNDYPNCSESYFKKLLNGQETPADD